MNVRFQRHQVRTGAALVCVFTIIAGLVILTGTPAEQSADPGSRGAGKPGTLALYTWLDKLGFSTSRVTGTFDLSGADVLVINDPTTDFSDADGAAVAAFVDGGGELIIGVDRISVDAADPVIRRLIGTSLGAGTHGGGLAHAVQPLNDANSAHVIPVNTGPAIDTEPNLAPLFVVDGKVVAAGVTGSAGRGRAFVIASTLPLSNDGLRHDDSAAFVLAMLERARGGRIAFDEYHHGEIGEAGAAAIFNGPVGLATVLLVVVIVLYLVLSGRRVGRALPAGDPMRVPSAGDYVAAMAALMERSHHRGGIADRYADELKRRIGAVSGIDAYLSDPDFVTALQGHPPDQVAAVAAALYQARSLAASQPSEQTLLHLAQHIDALERLWAGSTSVAAR